MFMTVMSLESLMAEQFLPEEIVWVGGQGELSVYGFQHPFDLILHCFWLPFAPVLVPFSLPLVLLGFPLALFGSILIPFAYPLACVQCPFAPFRLPLASLLSLQV